MSFSSSVDFQAMNGFLLLATQTGKLLYISDNAAEYLGHSMVSELILWENSLDLLKFGNFNCNLNFKEDLLIHGDSVYDIIDKQDHASIQSELLRNTAATSCSSLNPGKTRYVYQKEHL